MCRSACMGLIAPSPIQEAGEGCCEPPKILGSVRVVVVHVLAIAKKRYSKIHLLARLRMVDRR